MTISGNNIHLRKRATQLELYQLTVPLNVTAFTRGHINQTTFELKLKDTMSRSYARTFAVGGGDPQFVNGVNGLFYASDSYSYGGGTRQYIYGSALWGSGDGDLRRNVTALPPVANGYGYAWVPSLALNMTERRYPFGFWPLYWGTKYRPTSRWQDDSARPGGPQRVALVRSNEKSPITWWMSGDEESLKAVMPVLALPTWKGGCGVYNDTTLYTFDLDRGDLLRILPSLDLVRTNITLAPTSALQYYRTSSFALGLLAHYNPWSEPNNTATAQYWQTTPVDYPAVLARMNQTTPALSNTAGSEYLRLVEEQNQLFTCLNVTIAGSLPIYDLPSNVTTTSNDPARPNIEPRLGLIVGLSSGGLLLLLAMYAFYDWWRKKKTIARPQRRVSLAQHTGGSRVVFTREEAAQMMRARSRDESLPVYTPLLTDTNPMGNPPAYTRHEQSANG
ncbi:SubName: Full=Uncharacterized protein {ECO:0000313/EMBL:CCA72725.1} [Serendipita indica DSM 11827]|nr:SubName: Full=Uncharacterized protein {ECO:0000313/EMBL:CCA72725.1} [Serendipita indica DSM 11827]